MSHQRSLLGLKALSSMTGMSGIAEAAAPDRAGSFNGTNSELTAASADYRSSDSSGAISFWFKTTSNSAGTVFAAVDVNAQDKLLRIRILGTGAIEITHIQPLGRGFQTDLVKTTTGGYDDDSPHHCVVVSNGTLYSVYVDDVLLSLTEDQGANDGDWFAELTSGVDGIRIGVSENSAGKSSFFNGVIDEPIVFSSPLNSAEVSTLNNSGSGVLISDLESVDAALYAKAVNGWPLSINSSAGIGDDIIGSLDLTVSNVSDVAGLI